jgi:hypothetical protein
LNDLLLEEVERAGDQWLVTLGFTRPSRVSSLARAVGAGYNSLDPTLRDYKRIKIDSKTGEFRGMVDRRLEEQLR